MGMGLVPFYSTHWSDQKFSALERHRTWQGTIPKTSPKVYGRMLYIRAALRIEKCISTMRSGNSTWTRYSPEAIASTTAMAPATRQIIHFWWPVKMLIPKWSVICHWLMRKCYNPLWGCGEVVTNISYTRRESERIKFYYWKCNDLS